MMAVDLVHYHARSVEEAAAIEALLRETYASISDGTRPGGFHCLRRGDRTAAPKATSASIEKLRSATKVVGLPAPEASPPR